jgi:hypothetical protein
MISMGQDVPTADLVVQGIEAIVGFCLRFRVQRRLQQGAVDLGRNSLNLRGRFYAARDGLVCLTISMILSLTRNE